MAGSRLRVPQHVQQRLDHPVTYKGRRMTLREAIQQADPNEPYRLRNGRAITLQQMVDSVDAWEKRSNVRLATVAPHLPMPESTRAKLNASHNELSAELARRRAIAASAWRAIIDRPAGTPKSFSVRMARFPDGKPVVAGGATSSGRKPHPTTEPYDEVWSKQWGDPSDIGAYVNASFDNEFQFDDHSGPDTGCVGIVHAGGWLLGQSVEVARAYAGAGATEREVQGSARIYLMGNAVPVWQREGSFPLFHHEQAISTPQVSAPIATIEPVSVNVSLSGTGAALIDVGIQPAITPGRSFGCAVTVTPRVWTKALGGVALQPMEGLNQALDVLFGELTGGVEGEVTIFDVSLPTQLGLGAEVAPNGAVTSLDQNASAAFNADLLSGKLVAYVEMDLNEVVGFIAGLFGFSDTKRWEWDLHDWPGEHTQTPIAGPFHNLIPVTL